MTGFCCVSPKRAAASTQGPTGRSRRPGEDERRVSRHYCCAEMTLAVLAVYKQAPRCCCVVVLCAPTKEVAASAGQRNRTAASRSTTKAAERSRQPTCCCADGSRRACRGQTDVSMLLLSRAAVCVRFVAGVWVERSKRLLPRHADETGQQRKHHEGSGTRQATHRKRFPFAALGARRQQPRLWVGAAGRLSMMPAVRMTFFFRHDFLK